MSDAANTLHLVRVRPEWELKPFWLGVWYYRAPKKGGAVRAFASARRAEAFHKRLEQRARARLPRANPFLLCRDWDMNYEVVTSLPEFALFDWLQDVGLTRPEPLPHVRTEKLSSSDWYRWWQTTVDTMTPEQLDHMWRGLDRVRFYEVVSLEMS
jgi:hypothetical protein